MPLNHEFHLNLKFDPAGAIAGETSLGERIPASLLFFLAQVSKQPLSSVLLPVCLC